MAIQEIKVDGILYRFEGITQKEAETLCTDVLTDPVTQQSAVNSEVGELTVEIGYKLGVTDPIDLSLQKAANLVGISPSAVSSSRLCPSDGVPNLSQIETVISQKSETLIYESTPQPVERISIRDLSDNELEQLSKTRSLFLNLSEMKVIQNYYQTLGREATDLEIEMIAQTWSEHCAHKTFKAILEDQEGREKEPLFSRIKEASKRHFERVGVVTAFEDNAGGMRFYDGQVIIGKGETHNSPVAIEPYAGSLTKNGGLYRDIAGTGQGAKNLVGLMINNFASPFTRGEDVRPGTLHPNILLRENSRGERDYGNPMGIPTHAIDIHIHKDNIKPGSLGVAIGILPENRVKKGKPRRGDLIIAVGGKTGRDGIHGATFSSGAMTHETGSIHSTAVQLGDPIVEKTMFDALLECRDANLIRAITDCGAGGFSSAVGEIANGIGAQVWLEKIPIKYEGLASWEKWLSESQERMVVAVSSRNWLEFLAICERYDTNAEAIGYFTGDNKLTIYEEDAIVGEMDLEFLHEGLPQRRMQMRFKPYPISEQKPDFPTDFVAIYKAVLSHFNICSKEEMHRQYDMTVQGMTVMAPFIGVNQDTPSEASVLAPILNTKYGLVTSSAINPILNRIDPYWGSVWAFAHAATKYTSAGGDISQACGVDNYIAPFPTAEVLADVDKMTDGLCTMIDTLGVPMVSGKDSLSSTYKGPDGEIVEVPPSLNITIFGKIPDYELTVTPDFKSIGSTICLVGWQDIEAMGGSIYFDTKAIINSNIPKVDIKGLSKTLEVVRNAILDGKIKSAKAIGEGGMGASLAQMCFGGDCGAKIVLNDQERPDFVFFNETAGCIIVEIDSPDAAQETFGNISYQVIGQTTADKKIKVKDLFEADIDELREAWQQPMREILSAS